MTTIILADSFTASLAKLTNDEQKQAKLTAFDLQMDPDRPGLQMHRIDASKDLNFWSVRVNRDIRIVVHKTGDSIMLAFVAHHDDAYKWAERRRIETHTRTGALQIVEVRERVEVVETSAAIAQADLPFSVPLIEEKPQAAIFSALTNDDLLSIGVPEDWVSDVLAANEDRFFTLTDHLPQEAGERLLEYAATGILAKFIVEGVQPAEHPDAQRRFRILEGNEELAAALDQPLEKWAVFLHPSQRHIVEKDFSGPVRVVGSAGTGKTVVALHRVLRVLRHDEAARVLLTTFSEPLAQALRVKLKVLLVGSPHLVDRVAIASFGAAAADLYELSTGRKPYLISGAKLRTLINDVAKAHGNGKFSSQFLLSEWRNVVDAWQIDSAEAYADVPRMGRKNRLGAKQREELWSIFSELKRQIAAKALLTHSGLFAFVARHWSMRADKPFTHIVVDEAQDLGVAELKFLQAIAPDLSDALFFTGDIGQRIFQQPFSWRGLGIDIRGRSFSLKVNYRTSHQIRRLADRLMPQSVRDGDGEADDRRGTVSVFEGLEPVVVVAPSHEEEAKAAAAFLQQLLDGGMEPGDIGIFCRSNAEIQRVAEIARIADIKTTSTIEGRGAENALLIGTMHLAKGLEFKAVLVVACDEGVLPLTERVKDVSDEFELDEVVATERQLLYVAATRARDRLFISAVAPGSEFLEDIVELG